MAQNITTEVRKFYKNLGATSEF